jgi:hypothetical protein
MVASVAFLKKQRNFGTSGGNARATQEQRRQRKITNFICFLGIFIEKQ